MNNCVFYGRLTKDVELMYTQSNVAVGKFSIAVNRQFQGGEKKVDYFNITAFGKTAENIERYFRKGSRIVLKCHAQQEEYRNKDGQEVNTVGFVVDGFSFVDTRAEGGITQNQEQYQQHNYSQESMVGADGFMNIPDGLDDELPFN